MMDKPLRWNRGVLASCWMTERLVDATISVLLMLTGVLMRNSGSNRMLLTILLDAQTRKICLQQYLLL